MTKWAAFARVNGKWRFEGFIEEALLNKMEKEVEAENGLGSFRAHLFVDSKEL